jgi:choline dehydrogenase-like flavoprotein
MSQVLSASSIARDLELECDAVVIGTGAGGAVVGATLAEAGLSVTFIEEGAFYSTQDFNRCVPDMMSLLYRESAMTLAFGRPHIAIPLGRTVGGTTTINSGTCFRTPDPILQRWERDHRIERASPEAMDPYFSKVEKIQNVGPVRTQVQGKNAEIMARGAQALGYRHGPLQRNVTAQCAGCGMCCFGCPTGAKLAVGLTFIPKALSRGVTLVTQCRAEKLIFRGDQVVGIEGSFLERANGRKPNRVSVRARAVVVAAGAIGSPLFLLRNGLGRGLRHVGRHLTIHPASRASALFDEPIRGWQGVPQGYQIDQFHDEGILMENIHGSPALLGPTFPGVGRPYGELLKQFPYIAIFGAMVTDTSEGRVRNLVGWKPWITYQITAEDVARLQKSLVLTAEIFFAAGARRVFPPVYGWEELRSADDIRRFRHALIRPSDFDLMAFHPLGTCRMGIDATQSVVDSFGRVHGVKGLWVSDGSIFPSPPGVNPQITIMAFSMRNAERMAEELSGAR